MRWHQVLYLNSVEKIKFFEIESCLNRSLLFQHFQCEFIIFYSIVIKIQSDMVSRPTHIEIFTAVKNEIEIFETIFNIVRWKNDFLAAICSVEF